MKNTDLPLQMPRSVVADYLETCKPKVVALMLFTALAGMLLTLPGLKDIGLICVGLLGIGMVAGAAASVNHLADHRIDVLMPRTSHRPLPSGGLSRRQVLVFAVINGSIGATILFVWVNPLTAALTVLSLFGYAVVYTRYLKYATPQNIVIGGAAGATPPLLGWTTMTGGIDPMALLLFLIIFTWTPPHFWALAIDRKDEYAHAKVPMLPVTHGEGFTRLQILLYTVLLTPVTLLPYAIGAAGLAYLLGSVLLNGVYLYYAVRLAITHERAVARDAFSYSIVYLGLLFSLLLFDAWLPLLID